MNKFTFRFIVGIFIIFSIFPVSRCDEQWQKDNIDELKELLKLVDQLTGINFLLPGTLSLKNTRFEIVVTKNDTNTENEDLMLENDSKTNQEIESEEETSSEIIVENTTLFNSITEINNLNKFDEPDQETYRDRDSKNDAKTENDDLVLENGLETNQDIESEEEASSTIIVENTTLLDNISEIYNYDDEHNQGNYTDIKSINNTELNDTNIMRSPEELVGKNKEFNQLNCSVQQIIMKTKKTGKTLCTDINVIYRNVYKRLLEKNKDIDLEDLIDKLQTDKDKLQNITNSIIFSKDVEIAINENDVKIFFKKSDKILSTTAAKIIRSLEKENEEVGDRNLEIARSGEHFDWPLNIVLGGVGLILGIVLILSVCCSRNKDSKTKESNMVDEIMMEPTMEERIISQDLNNRNIFSINPTDDIYSGLSDRSFRRSSELNRDLEHSFGKRQLNPSNEYFNYGVLDDANPRCSACDRDFPNDGHREYKMKFRLPTHPIKVKDDVINNGREKQGVRRWDVFTINDEADIYDKPIPFSYLEQKQNYNRHCNCKSNINTRKVHY